MPEPRPPHTLLETLEAWEAEVVHGLVERLQLTNLLRHFPPRLVWAGFTFINGFLSIATLAVVAMVSREPALFPSLGPTAFMHYFHPRTAASSPRNTLVGHALGILCGYGSLWLVGLQHAPSVLTAGVDGWRVLAAAFSLATTAAAMILFSAVHPPAGATTLIVSLGLATAPLQLLIIEGAVALMTVQTIVVNRLTGLDYPLWSRRATP